LACVKLDKKKPAEAIKIIFENIRAKNKNKNPQDLALNYILLSNIYGSAGSDSLSAIYMKRSLEQMEIARKKGIKVIFSNFETVYYRVNISIRNKQYDDAKIYLNKLKYIINSTKDTSQYNYINSIVIELAFVCLSHHYNYGTINALSLFKGEKTQAYHDVLHLYNTIHFINQKNALLARKEYQKTKIYKNGNSREHEGLCLEIETKIYELEKNYRLAYLTQKKYQALENERYALLKDIEILSLEEKIKGDTKDILMQSIYQKYEIHFLEAQKKQTQIDFFNKVLVFYSIIIVILVIGITVTMFLLRKVRTFSKLLEQKNQSKERILSVLGHDLRSPIISLHSHLNAFPFALNDPQKIILWKKNHSKYINTLLLSVNNLLFWALSQRNRIYPKTESVVILDIIEEVIEELQVLIEQSNLSVIIDKIGNESILFDENHFKIIVRNIIHNAIKFTPKDGYILISLVNQMLVIEDSGIGLNGSIKNDKPQGTKLGIELINYLISLNNARISFEDKKENSGLRVSINFATVS
jgi:signal transduction histidine kinase